MREWLRQLAEQGFDPLAEEVALQSGGVRFKQLVDKVRNSWAKQRGEYDFSHEVMEAMAGCLACKACTSQCPIKVDVPDFRARFMQLYHGRYLRAPKDYFVGTVESYAPLLAKAPKLVNFFLEKSGPRRRPRRVSAWSMCRCSRCRPWPRACITTAPAILICRVWSG